MISFLELAQSLGYVLALLALAIAGIAGTWLTAISRNPESADKMFVPGIVALSCVEIVSISCVGLLFQLVSKG